MEEICCPKFNPEPWQDKSFNWQDKLFIKASSPTIFHIPRTKKMEETITALCKKAEEAGAMPQDAILMANDPSAFKSDWYLSVDKEVPGENNVRLSGEFISKVFDGPYKDVPKFMKQTNNYVKSQGKSVKKHFHYYAYCPKCSEKYGHNYIVDIAEV